MYKRILVPVDLDHVQTLTTALDLAAKMAQDGNGSLILVGVVDAAPTATTRTDGDRIADALATFSKEQSDKYGIKIVDHVQLRGDLHVNVGKDIVTAAKDNSCDLIVMASHVPGLKEHIIASNAGYVASHAPMSVFVVR